MTESLIVAGKNATKKEKYELLMPQLTALVEGEKDVIANLANLMAALKEAMGFLWIGVYFVKENDLVLGPFQGPLACTRIPFGKGVCGKAWQERKTIIVPDVDQYPGHIACSSLAKSEIVVLVYKNDEVKLIIDADSEQLSTFDETDQHYLQSIAGLIESLL